MMVRPSTARVADDTRRPVLAVYGKQKAFRVRLGPIHGLTYR